MDHQSLEKTSSVSPMLPKEKDKTIILTQQNGPRILIREDTILANLPGCAGCGRAQFACGGMKKKWSALCWGKQSEKKYYCSLVVLSATFALSLLGTIFFCFTNVINDAILSSMVLKNNSLAFSMWRRPTVHPLMKVHLFNYTNWERVRDGLDTKFHVQDVGPYVYSQQLERVKIKFVKDLLTFQEHNNFKFLPEASAGAHFDKVSVPNLPLLGVTSKFENAEFFARMGVQAALNTFGNHKEAFLQLPVQRFLWGYDDNIITLAKPYLSFQGQLNFDNFGLLVTKNGTSSDVFTINTGEHDINRMNIIEEFNGHKALPYWGSPECNSIEASDGSIFPPTFLDRNQTLKVFFPNLCRSIPFNYVKDVEMGDGVNLLRYAMPRNVFDDPDHNPANQCYCQVDTGSCPPRGVIDVTQCAMGAPALASFPHFHLGDPALRERFVGLNPDSEQHQSYLDIHPTLGIALSGKSNLQLNIQVKKPESFGPVHYLPQGLILPIAWIEMSVEELPESLQSLVYHGTYSTAAAQLGLSAFCTISLTVSAICLFVMLVRRRRKPCAIVKIVSTDTELKTQFA
ncbi:scavenger receptor class B member 1-like [Maniola hyperantus]|uniref:scavenger receptor class B member 1-like n=1 Tax=Aphantopus hyperantus TaxID=2795564 RepID=UPI001569680E|nr:scavenger receptor class B member 1-like [Maniola hyperantus]